MVCTLASVGRAAGARVAWTWGVGGWVPVGGAAPGLSSCLREQQHHPGAKPPRLRLTDTQTLHLPPAAPNWRQPSLGAASAAAAAPARVPAPPPPRSPSPRLGDRPSLARALAPSPRPPRLCQPAPAGRGWAAGGGRAAPILARATKTKAASGAGWMQTTMKDWVRSVPGSAAAAAAAPPPAAAARRAPL